MTIPEQNKDIVCRFNKEFIEHANEQVFHDTIAADFINHTAPPGMPKGPEGVLYFFNNFLKPAFPDLRVEIYDQVAAGDKVATRKAFHATHKGEFLGIPASHKKIVLEVIDIVRLRDGKFVEHWNVLDLHGLLMQIKG